MEFKARILDEEGMMRSITRLAHEIIEHNKGIEDVVLIGIHSRGVPIANLIGEKIKKIEGKDVSIGSIDITMYRDDLSEIDEKPLVKESKVDFDITGKNVVLVDDVIYTGRTVRAALDAVMDIGRPNTIQLAVLIDRGHRELPIRADYIGKNVPTSKKEIVKVRIKTVDKINEVAIYKN